MNSQQHPSFTFIPKAEEIPWWVDEYVISKLFI
jgi:hypothetical protein